MLCGWPQAVKRLVQAWSNEAMKLASIFFDIYSDDRHILNQRHCHNGLSKKNLFNPQVIGSIFTEREDIFHLVKEFSFATQNDSSSRQQQSYIIHGIGGSGTKKFCLSFAQDHCER